MVVLLMKLLLYKENCTVCKKCKYIYNDVQCYITIITFFKTIAKKSILYRTKI